MRAASAAASLHYSKTCKSCSSSVDFPLSAFARMFHNHIHTINLHALLLNVSQNRFLHNSDREYSLVCVYGIYILYIYRFVYTALLFATLAQQSKDFLSLRKILFTLPTSKFALLVICGHIKETDATATIIISARYNQQ